MKYFKELFSFETKDIKYKKTIISFIICTLLFAIISFLLYLIDKYVIKSFIINILLAVAWLLYVYLLIAFVVRLINVSDNKEIINKKKGKYKPKFDSINVDFKDIVFWLKNTDEPETITCKYNNFYFEISVSFDVIGIQKKYYNKQYYLNDANLTEEQIIIEIENKLIDGCLIVCSTFDNSRPEILLKKIEELKK